MKKIRRFETHRYIQRHTLTFVFLYFQFEVPFKKGESSSILTSKEKNNILIHSTYDGSRRTVTVSLGTDCSETNDTNKTSILFLGSRRILVSTGFL